MISVLQNRCNEKNPLSDLFAREALRLLGKNIQEVCFNGKSSNACEEMILGYIYAGMVFASSPVRAVHALANPIVARFHVPHGTYNALMQS